MNLKLLLVITAFACAPFLMLAQSAKNLPSGLYIITTTQGLKITEALTNKQFNIELIPIVTTKHLIQVSNRSRHFIINGSSQNIQILRLLFDTESVAALKRVTQKLGSTDGSIGLVINGELKLVARVSNVIEKPEMDLQLNNYSFTKANALKIEIENSIKRKART